MKKNLRLDELIKYIFDNEIKAEKELIYFYSGLGTWVMVDFSGQITVDGRHYGNEVYAIPEEKKYYYEAPFKEESYRYLNYRNIKGTFHLNTHEDNTIYKTQFTDKEMDKILEEINDEDTTRFVNGLKKVEVQEWYSKRNQIHNS